MHRVITIARPIEYSFALEYRAEYGPIKTGWFKTKEDAIKELRILVDIYLLP